MEDQGPNPIAPDAIIAAADKLARAWKRVSARAPDDVRERIEALVAEVEPFRVAPEALQATSVRERLDLAKRIENFQLELRGQVPFQPQFYQGGRLAIIRVYDPVRIVGAVDHRRVEAFFERYLRRAEESWARMIYFMKRAGIDVEKEEKKLAAWEQPYSDLEEYREFIWGKAKLGPRDPPP